MPDYSKLVASARLDEDGENCWQTNWPPYEETPTMGSHQKIRVSGALGITLPIPATVSSLLLLAIRNEEPIAGRTMAINWRDTGGTNSQQSVQPQAIAVIPSINPAIAITLEVIGSDTSNLACRIAWLGS
jgi:hypothetical protein